MASPEALVQLFIDIVNIDRVSKEITAVSLALYLYDFLLCLDA